MRHINPRTLAKRSLRVLGRIRRNPICICKLRRGTRISNIGVVVQNHLCHGCGVCYAVCPRLAIHMENSGEEGHFVPVIDEKCINCNLCLRVCPGYDLDLEKLNEVIFNSQPENSKVGVYKHSYFGHSNDEDIRYNSASGGLITQILITLLEEGMIDGALVTSMDPSNPLQPMSILATTKEEVIEASRSKYCPVTIAEALRKIFNTEGRYAVVGLPCHIHGIRKAEQVLPHLRGRVVLHFGLLCSHMVGFPGIHFLLEKKGIDYREVVEMQYRGRGWPGSMLIKERSGAETTIPLTTGWHSYWPIFASYFFTPNRCLMCPDQMAEFADMSFGDAWLPESRDDKIGNSVIITKNDFADKVLRDVARKHHLVLDNISIDRIEESQQPNLVFKKVDLGARLGILSAKGYKTPNFNPEPMVNSSPLSVLRTFLVLLNYSLSKLIIFKRVGLYIPFPIFRVYNGCFKYLYKI